MTPRVATWNLASRPFVAYVAYFKNAMRSVLVYRVDLAIAIVSQIVQVLVLAVVWTTVYGVDQSVQNIDRMEAVGYAVLASCVQTVLMPWNFSSLADRVRGGQVGIDMIRPLGLISQCIMRNIGAMCARLPVAIVGVAVAAAIGALVLPADRGSAALFLVSMTLGAMIAVLLNLLVSFIVFWSLETSGYMMLYRLGSGLASGALIPLWFMPDWLAESLEWLPFQAQVFAPLSIYLGHVSGARVWLIVCVQIAWIAASAFALRIAWGRAVHKVVVLGG